jgi:hypothetical protein
MRTKNCPSGHSIVCFGGLTTTKDLSPFILRLGLLLLRSGLVFFRQRGCELFDIDVEADTAFDFVQRSRGLFMRRFCFRNVSALVRLGLFWFWGAGWVFFDLKRRPVPGPGVESDDVGFVRLRRFDKGVCTEAGRLCRLTLTFWILFLIFLFSLRIFNFFLFMTEFLLRKRSDCRFWLFFRVGLAPAVFLEFSLHFLITFGPLLQVRLLPGLEFLQHFVQFFDFVPDVTDIFL